MRGDADEERRSVLAKRAAILARPNHGGVRREILFDAALVGVGGERFAIPAHSLRAVERLPVIARLPGLPAWVIGIAHLQGQLVTAIDLGAWLAVEGAGRVAYLALLDTAARPVALGVEAVLGFRTIYLDEITELGEGPRSAILAGTTRDLISVLDAERLVESQELLVGGPVT